MKSTHLCLSSTPKTTKVPIDQVDAFVQKLENYGKEFQYIRAKEGEHGFIDWDIFLEFTGNHQDAPSA